MWLVVPLAAAESRTICRWYGQADPKAVVPWFRGISGFRSVSLVRRNGRDASFVARVGALMHASGMREMELVAASRSKAL